MVGMRPNVPRLGEYHIPEIRRPMSIATFVIQEDPAIQQVQVSGSRR